MSTIDPKFTAQRACTLRENEKITSWEKEDDDKPCSNLISPKCCQNERKCAVKRLKKEYTISGGEGKKKRNTTYVPHWGWRCWGACRSCRSIRTVAVADPDNFMPSDLVWGTAAQDEDIGAATSSIEWKVTAEPVQCTLGEKMRMNNNLRKRRGWQTLFYIAYIISGDTNTIFDGYTLA